MDIVEYSPTMDCVVLATDLKLESDYVERYLQNYSITHVMPIRTLDYQKPCL